MLINEVSGRIGEAKQILVFTGAGLSTGSGIPDFRGPDGLWKTWRPVYYQEFMGSHQARVAHWEFKLAGWKAFREALPNAAHRALVQLEKQGKLDALVTQNIDGLHQLAGQSPERLIELHGTNRLIECQTCRRTSEPDPVYDQFEKTRRPPLCSCGGFLKPATVSFGQSLPQDKLEAAFQAARRADLVMAVGSSLEVEPAASVPRLAAQKGAVYVILNQGPTAHDHLADLRLEGDCTLLLPQLLLSPLEP